MMRLLFEALSIIALLLMVYACCSEVPEAIQKEEDAYQDSVMLRCVKNGDYNMADAFCVAAAKERGQ